MPALADGEPFFFFFLSIYVRARSPLSPLPNISNHDDMEKAKQSGNDGSKIHLERLMRNITIIRLKLPFRTP